MVPADTFKDNDFGVPPGTTTADVFKFTGCRKVGCLNYTPSGKLK